MPNFKKINIATETTPRMHYHFMEESCLYRVYTTKEDGTKYLECIDRECSCKAVIRDAIMTRTNRYIHHHGDHLARIEAEQSYWILKEQVASTDEPILMLHRKILRCLSADASGYLTWDGVRKTLQRIRQADQISCKDLKELEDLLENNEIINQRYGMMREHEFYMGCVSRQLVFANVHLIQELPERTSFYFDATFGVVPLESYQLLIILAELRGKPRPICYILMDGKHQQKYEQVFNFISESVLCIDGVERKPTTTMTDFEMGLRNAIRSVWPEVELYGCNFHFCQALRRRAKSMGLLDSSENARYLIMWMRISLLPVSMIRDAITTLINNMEEGVRRDFAHFISYFRREWLETFTIADWAVADQPRRTNNSLEGYNVKIKSFIRIKPTVWEFLDGIRDLGFDAISKYEYDVRVGRLEFPDRSELSQELPTATIELLAGDISVIEFLERMSSFNAQSQEDF